MSDMATLQRLGQEFERGKMGPISKAIADGKTYQDYVDECRLRREQKGRVRAFKPRGPQRKLSRPKLVSIEGGVAEFSANIGIRFTVDEVDAPLVATLSIQVTTGRVTVRTEDGATMLSRVLTNAPANLCVDHIDGDPLNNTRANLRICTAQNNAWNMAARLNSATMQSRYKGVSRMGKKWRAYIVRDGKQKHLGVHLSEIAAAQAYDEAARTIFGAFCCVNFPRDGEQSAHRRSHR